MEKILLIHTKYQNFGGEDQSIINEIELLKENYNVETLINTNKITNLFKDIFTILLNRNFSFEKKLKRKLKEYEPDYIYVHNTWFKTSLGIFKILNQYNKPVLLKLHNFRYHCTANYLHKNHLQDKKICEACGIEYAPKKIFNKYFEESYIKSFFAIKYGKKYLNIIKNSNIRILSLTQFHRQFLIEKGISDNRISIIPNFISIKTVNSKLSDEKYYVYAGRISKEKGIPELLDCFNSIQINSIKLKVIGDGPLLKNLVNKYSHNLNIEFLGNINNKEVLSIIKNSIGVVTATKLYEGQPTLLCEASSLGVPSIFPNTGGIKEFFPENYIYSFNQFEYDDLTKKLVQMNKNTETKKIGKENQLYISNILNKEEIIRKFKLIMV